MGLPTVDGDLMGRAFPELQMCTPAYDGIPLTPAALADEKGNEMIVSRWAVRSCSAALCCHVCVFLTSRFCPIGGPVSILPFGHGRG